MMKIRGTHIPEKILKARNKRIPVPAFLEIVQKIFEEESKKDNRILEVFEADFDNVRNELEFDLLETNRIFHIADIEKICVEYRLRFLNSSLYKAPLPYEAIARIKEIEKAHNIQLIGFKMMAPASLFKLENADDPLLFAPMGNDYYYLIHSWGKDLHPFRRMLMWPFRHLENFMFFLLALSFLLAFLVPDGLFGKEQSTTEFIIIFFFMFKWVTGLAIFYGFKCGKNFSSAIWQSKYYNA